MEPRQIIIWLRAGSTETLQEDLLTAALDLKSELLRFESRNPSVPGQQTGVSEGLLYSSGVRLNYLLDLLKLWLKTAQADKPKVLIVLDDLDGLEPSKLSELSDLISGDHIEVIYSTRDPMIADQTSYMSAANFDVPPLTPDDALDLFLRLMNPHPGFAQGRDPGPITDLETTAQLLTSIGHLPAAIVNATHYSKDNYGSTNPDALREFLAKWNSSVKGGILQFRRRTFIYPHTMQASFEVSLTRLKRNLGIESPRLYNCSLYLLRLLSLMGVNEFARNELGNFGALLRYFISREKAENAILHHLSSDASVIHRCVTELVHVSLLSDPEGRGILVLNNLTKACVWLTVTQNLGDTALLERLLERAARFLARTWATNREAEIATALETPVTSIPLSSH